MAKRKAPGDPGYCALYGRLLELYGRTQTEQAAAAGLDQPGLSKRLSGARAPRSSFERLLVRLLGAALLDPTIDDATWARIVDRERELRRLMEPGDAT